MLSKPAQAQQPGLSFSSIQYKIPNFTPVLNLRNLRKMLLDWLVSSDLRSGERWWLCLSCEAGTPFGFPSLLCRQCGTVQWFACLLFLSTQGKMQKDGGLNHLVLFQCAAEALPVHALDSELVSASPI